VQYHRPYNGFVHGCQIGSGMAFIPALSFL
jgi:hypothetical protein